VSCEFGDDRRGYDPFMASEKKSGAAFSLVSILALVAAMWSFSTSSVPGGLVLAIIAIVLGAIGFVIALLPGIRGGVISFISMGAGAIGIVVALIRLIGRVVS